MIFAKQEPLSILVCRRCHGTGRLTWNSCPECHGFGSARLVRDKLLYWKYPLERFNLAERRLRRIHNKIRWITCLVLALNFWIWTIYFSYKNGALNALVSFDWSAGAALPFVPFTAKIFFWLGAVLFLYLWYRTLRETTRRTEVEHHVYDKEVESSASQLLADWSGAMKISRRARLDIAGAFTEESLKVLEDAYRLSDQASFNSVNPFHLFHALLSSNRIGNIFLRLGIPASVIQKAIAPLFAKDNSTTGGIHTAPVISDDLIQILFYAYEEAFISHQSYVSAAELLVATVKQSPEIQEILFDLKIDRDTLVNVVEWARIKERMYRGYMKFRRAAAHRSKYGMDRAMTAVATPYLNRFSEDITIMAQYGHLDHCVARDKEMEEVFRVLEGGRQNVLLVGEYGVGKKSIVEGIAERMVSDDVPIRLRDKRLVRLSIPSLLAGTTPSGAVERTMTIMNEILRAGNIILFVHNLHELIGVSAGTEDKSLDVAGTLVEFLTSPRFVTIATTTTDSYAKYIANSNLSSVFSKVEIPEMDENQAIQVLESKAGLVEYKQQVFFAYNALSKAVKLCRRYIHDSALPGSALEIMNESAGFARSKKGINSMVTGEEVAVVVAEKTKIPVTSVGADEGDKLLHLEEEMHKRVIGQEEAVDLVANSLRRARAEIRSTTRPIASFLFLGPTGVGKTELAKTIAAVYFGGEDRMIRIDMSEYQDKTSIYRLIGAPGEKGTGLLTEAVRRSSFALVLLDEIEKADKDILNLFLQVMDDGRLTDSSGRVVDFTNTIIIATSNAATATVQEDLRGGISPEVVKEKLLHGGLQEFFRPEFLNRFDGIVLFRSLDVESIKKIAGLMLKRVSSDLMNKGIELSFGGEALDYFSSIGFDPTFGARPMRRVIQEKVENQLAELLLGGKLKRRDIVEIGAEGVLTVRTP